MAKTQSPTAFKHWIDGKLLRRIADAIGNAHPSFDRHSFLMAEKKLAPLELKGRVRFVRDELKAHLPSDYPRALAILLKSLKGGTLKGFDLWPYTEFVQTYGLGRFEESMAALREMTKLFTAEFAVRPFIIADQERTLTKLAEWATDENEHVRRLVSEGTRPRLPWGERLHALVADPSPTLHLLEALKHDESIYVRKSVANHLNDITKDHGELVLRTLARWQKEAPPAHRAKVDWITRRALRTMVKAGHRGALSLCGATEGAKVELRGLKIARKDLRFPTVLEFSFEITSTAKTPQNLVIDYVIHHRKADGGTTPKVFKHKTCEIKGGETLTLNRKHAIKPITTRRYYGGEHRLEIQVNGNVLGKARWTLKMPKEKP